MIVGKYCTTRKREELRPVELTLVSDVAVLLALVPTGVDAEDDGIRISLKAKMTFLLSSFELLPPTPSMKTKGR